MKEIAPPALVQAAGPEDLPEIAALAAVVWRAHYPGIISPAQIDYMLARMYDVGAMRSETEHGITYLRATVDGSLRGFAAFGPLEEEKTVAPQEPDRRRGPATAAPLDSTAWKLHKLYVDPKWQRRGIGAALLAGSENAARSHGSTQLTLNVNKRNEQAIAAYRRHGFVIHDSVIVDIGNGFVMDDFIMVKQLNR